MSNDKKTSAPAHVYRRANAAPGAPTADTAQPVPSTTAPAAAGTAKKLPPKWKIGLLAICLAALLLLLVVLVIFAACAQDGTVPISSGISSTLHQASSDESYDRSAYQIDKAAYPDTVLSLSDDAGIEYAEETLFLGDSNTERMLYYSDVTGVTTENGIGVVSMGITTFSTQLCASFKGYGQVTMPKAVELLQPRRVVMTFGTNNVGMEIDRFIEYYEAAIDAVLEAYPHTYIIIGSIFPVDQYRQNTAITMKRIDQMNQALAEMAQRKEVKFLNWSEAILDEETGHSLFEATIQDGVHLTRAGMENIFDYFRTHSYIVEDTRPALTDIPERQAVQPGTITQDPNKVAGPIDWSKETSSSSQSGSVNVVFSAWDQTLGTSGGGTLSGGGSSGSSITLAAAPGATTASVQAIPNSGYEFVGWNCSVGSINSGATLSGFTIPGDVSSGSTVTVTAIFQQVATASSSSSSISSSSASSTPSSESPTTPSSSQTPSSSEPPPSSSSSSSSSSEPPVVSSTPVSSTETPSSTAEPVEGG